MIDTDTQRRGRARRQELSWVLAVVLLCVATAVELAFLARAAFRDREAAQMAADGSTHTLRAEDYEPAPPSKPMPDGEKNFAANASAEIDALVRGRLADRRARRRGVLIDALAGRLEEETQRQLSPAERGELAAACGAYFAAIDGRDTGDPTGDPRKLVAAAIRGRLNVLARILGSEEEAERVLSATLYAQVAP